MIALKVESWIWWSVVISIIFCRLTSRYLALGSLKHFQADDYLMLFVICTYTTLIVTINIVANTDSNLLPPGFDVNTLTPADIKHREYGSKLVLVVEQCQCFTVWTVKACLLIMYSRLTVGRGEHRALQILAGYVAFGFIFMEIFYFGVWCRPFSNYWAVPTPNVQCDAATDHLITNATFNISSDLILISIALPMFIRLMLPWRKKIVLILIFSLGFFVILAAILNKYYSFTQPFGAMWTFWYVRESSTAILVANLPFLWTLVRRVFHVSSLDGASRTNSLSPKGTLSRSDKARKSSNAVDPISGRRLSSNGSGDLEMAEARILDRPMGREDLTFEEMLKADSTASTNDSRELPYAGPQFQYSVWAEGPASPPKSPPMKKAVLHERKQSETCRRESLPERRGSAAPLAHSITAGSENSPKSSSFLL